MLTLNKKKTMKKTASRKKMKMTIRTKTKVDKMAMRMMKTNRGRGLVLGQETRMKMIKNNQAKSSRMNNNRTKSCQLSTCLYDNLRRNLSSPLY